MFVQKRGGRKESVMFDKITSRVQKLCYNLNMDFVDPASITAKVIQGMYPGVTTVELDNMAAEIAATMSTHHPDYAILAARIAISNLHKETKKNFSDVVEDLYNAPHEESEKPIISQTTYEIVMKNKDKLNSVIIYDRDFSYNYFGFKTLEKNCLLKINGKVVERPQHMLMRTAVGIHGNNIDDAIKTYNLLSENWFIHSPETLLNAGTSTPYLLRSYLLTMKSDSIEGIFDSLLECSIVSTISDNIGFNVHCIRAAGSYISSTNGTSNGLVPLLRVYDESPANLCIYLEPWHSDIFEYLNLKKATGKEETRTRNLNYAVWIPDLFMNRVEKDEMWSLMSPDESPNLADVWGKEFEELYEKYEKQGLYRKQIKAQSLWFAIIDSQMKTGMPHVMYKDACNRKSNQQNLGTIKGSNLSAELVEYSSPDEIAACSQASISLDKFVSNQEFDFSKLKEITKVVTRNLDLVIDANMYCFPEAETSNKCHRPIGISVHGLADAFILMRHPYESDEAQKLNRQIFETVYYGALEASCELAEEFGPYKTYAGSPASKGVLQYDMWNAQPSNLWNWNVLKEKIERYGLRNSLLVALMPTEIESQILGNNNSVDAYASNVFIYQVMAKEFHVVNHHLLKDLTEKGLWNTDLKNELIASNGSVQKISSIPEELKALYKTVWEIPQRTVLKMAVDRGCFIDQSQAVNVHMLELNYGKLTSMHFFGWRMGLKTGMFRLKTSPLLNTIYLTNEKAQVKKEVHLEVSKERIKNLDQLVCSINNKEACLMCSS